MHILHFQAVDGRTGLVLHFQVVEQCGQHVLRADSLCDVPEGIHSRTSDACSEIRVSGQGLDPMQGADSAHLFCVL